MTHAFGYIIIFMIVRLMSYSIALMAVWGIYDPDRFFGGRIFAGIGLFMSGQIYLISLVMEHY